MNTKFTVLGNLPQIKRIQDGCLKCFPFLPSANNFKQFSTVSSAIKSDTLYRNFVNELLWTNNFSGCNVAKQKYYKWNATNKHISWNVSGCSITIIKNWQTHWNGPKNQLFYLERGTHFRIQEHVPNSMDHFETTCIMLVFQPAWGGCHNHWGIAIRSNDHYSKGYKREDCSIVTLVPNYRYSLHGSLCYYPQLLRQYQLLL